MSKEIEAFIRDYLKEIEENNAAIFAGAGLSAGSGFVNWKNLLKDFADDLSLDITKENDLVSLAQYHLNKNGNNRHSLSQKILNEFHHGKSPNDNHRILAKLPIATYWTTNYDKLIERALNDVGKIVDVKYTTNHLAKTIHGRDAILYKMHGDVDHTDDAIISKDQYERYYKSHGAYINTLSGDLVSKTFLFIGFSFTDPNLDYILSRLRVSFENHQRKHYCLIREVKQEEGENEKDLEYKKIKQALIINDLLRFNIHVLLIKEHSEITNILRELENRFKRRSVYISGSAYEYKPFEVAKAEDFISLLSKELIRNNFKIVSGFGLGVGSFVINGILEEVYLHKKEKLGDQLMLRPFPQGMKGQELWEPYREDMISYAGISIFIFGNKLENGETVSAAGVRKEFEIAKKQNVLLIPVGATGSMAKELYNEVISDFSSFYGSDQHIEAFKQLNETSSTPEELTKSILSFINHIIK